MPTDATPGSDAESGKGLKTTWTSPANLALLLLLAINLFNYIDRQILAAVVPNIRDEFFGPHAQSHGAALDWMLNSLGSLLGSKPENAVIGLLAMAFMLTYMLLAPVFGFLKLKRWWIIAAGIALWSLASGASGLAATFGILLITRCLVGVGEAAYGPFAPAMIADYFPVSQRGTKMAWFTIASPVGSALGFILGGIVAAHWGWRWAFYLVVPPGLLLTLLCLALPEPRQGESDGLAAHHGRGASLRDYPVLLRTPSYVYNVLGSAAMTFAIGGLGFWMPSYFNEFRHAGSLEQVNVIFGIILVLAGITGTPFGGWVSDRLRGRYPTSDFAISSLSIMIGLPCVVASLYVPFPWAWLCIFAACFCLFFNSAPTMSAMANVVHPSMRASAFALGILITHALGDVVSPMVIGAVADYAHSMTTAFLFMAAIMFIGGMLWLFGCKHLARDTERALEVPY